MVRLSVRLAIIAAFAVLLPVPTAAQGRGGGGSTPPPPPPPPITLVNPTVSDCYSGAGCLDSTFGSLGKALVDIGPSNDATIVAIAVQADGKMVAAAQRLVGDPSGGDWSWVIGRFLPDGTTDTTFGAAGLVTFNVNATGVEWPNEVSIQPDGKILVAGSLGGAPTIVRLTAAGALDATFGTGGKVALDLAGSSNVGGMAVQADGKIVVSTAVSGIGAYVWRLATNGAVDKTFGTKGTRLIANLSSTDLKLQSTGGIVVAGGWNGTALVARLTSAGDLDTTFGTKGITQMDFGSSADSFLTMSVGADDSIAAAGIMGSTAGTYNMIVGKLSAKGIPSASFGTNGGVVLDMFGLNDRANGVALQADGRVVFSGWAGRPTSSGSRKDAVIGRLLGTGVLDTSFGAGGVTVTEFDPYMHIEPITMTTNTGEIVVAGGVGLSASPPQSSILMLLRYFQ